MLLISCQNEYIGNPRDTILEKKVSHTPLKLVSTSLESKGLIVMLVIAAVLVIGLLSGLFASMILLVEMIIDLSITALLIYHSNIRIYPKDQVKVFSLLLHEVTSNVHPDLSLWIWYHRPILSIKIGNLL